MKKSKKNFIKTIFFISMIFTLSACFSKQVTDEEIETDNKDILQEEADVINETKEEKFVEFDILITTQAINVRTSHEVKDNNKNGLANMGEIYTVYETYEDNEFIWYKIGNDKWIANDGTWCAKFSMNDEKTYPYVLDEDEKKEFMESINTNGKVGFSHDNFEDASIIILSNPKRFFESINNYNYVDANIIFGIRSSGTLDSYLYNVTNVVKVNENEYDAYLEVVTNNGFEEYSLGCIKFKNIDLYDDAYLNFNAILIRNNNNINNDRFRELYNLEIYFFVSGQVSI